MLAVRTRSGLVETYHDGAVAICNPDGSLVASAGDIDRPFFMRSAAKPFQTLVSQTAGAGLEPLQLAMATASHHGLAVHVALIEQMLADVGLSPSALRCPPSWPVSPTETRRVAGLGHRDPRPIWNNCSGKHAGFLRACVAAGWPTESYLDPGHPLQRRVVDLVSDLTGMSVEPVGVDGCGAPVLRTTARRLAVGYARLGAEGDLRPVFDAMHRYPSMLAGDGGADAAIATAIDAAAKGGALGCLGVAVDGRLGLGVKSWDGHADVAGVAAVAALDALGELPQTATAFLESVARPVSTGGSSPVGALENRLELKFA